MSETKLTRQGVRDLNYIPAPKREPVAILNTCAHERMRYTSCGHCKFNCAVTCRDCGFYWMLYEGTLG